MSLPDLRVEVAFSTPPMSDSPVWTDISDYVELQESVTGSRGRSDEFDEVQSGQFSVVLNNTDGRFTPSRATLTDGVTANPYYPFVTDGRRIRIVATDGVTEWPRYDGYVNEWPVEWENGSVTRPWSRVTATDRFKRLSTSGELLSPLEYEVLADNPTLYYTLSEESETTAAGNTAGNDRPAAVVRTAGSGTLEFGAGTGPGTDEMSAAVWDAPHNDDDVPLHTVGNSAWMEAHLDPPIVLDATSNGITLECWARPVTASPSSSYRYVNIFDRVRAGTLEGDLVPGIVIGNNLSNQFFTRVTSSDPDPNDSQAYTGATVVDDHTHHFVVTCEPNTTNVRIRLYLDGVEVHTATVGFSTFEAANDTLHIGEDAFSSDADNFLGTMSHVAVYEHVLDAARIQVHYDVGKEGYSGDTSGARVQRIAEFADIPTGQIDTEGGLSTFTGMRVRGQGALEALQDVATSENGVVFVGRDGQLVFHGRDHRYNTASSFTLDAEANILGEDIRFQLDDAYTRNDIYITRDPGPALRRFDATSIEDRGRYRDDIELLTDSDEEAIDAAEYRLHAYGVPRARISEVTLRLHELAADPNTAALVATLLNADVGDRFTVTNLPPSAPADELDLWIEGYEETITDEVWELKLSTSPVLDGQDFWQLGVAGHSELGTTTVLGYGPGSQPIGDGVVPQPRTWSANDYMSPALFNKEIRDMFRWLLEPPAIKLSLSGAVTIPNGSDTSIKWNYEYHKNDLIHSNHTDENPERITVNTPGCYLIVVRTEIEAETGAGTNKREMKILRNGAALLAAANGPQPAFSTPSRMTVAEIHEMAAGDYFTVVYFQNSGGGLDLNPTECEVAVKMIARRAS